MFKRARHFPCGLEYRGPLPVYKMEQSAETGLEAYQVGDVLSGSSDTEEHKDKAVKSVEDEYFSEQVT